MPQLAWRVLIGIQTAPKLFAVHKSTRLLVGPSLLTDRDGNGYPKPETRRVFAPLGYGFGSTFRPVGLLMGTKSYLLGLWA